MNITDRKYTYLGSEIRLPEGTSVRSFLEQCYDSVPHEKQPVEKTEYADEFEEFYAESAWIIRGKASRVPFGVAVVSATVESLEVLKGDASKLRYNPGTREFTVATLENTMEEGREYIIGLVQAIDGPYYQISTRTAVKPVDDALIERVKAGK